MISFLLSIVALIAGYFLLSRLSETIFGIDRFRKTPAVTMADGVDLSLCLYGRYS
jgi:carbon starvation protein CstA